MPTLVVPGAVRARGFPTPYALAWPDKMPTDRDVYTLDVGHWLAEAAFAGLPDTVFSATVVASPTLLGGLGVDTVSLGGSTASAWVHDGSPGQTFALTYTLTSAGGRTYAVDTRLAVKVPAYYATQPAGEMLQVVTLRGTSPVGGAVVLTTDGSGIPTASNTVRLPVNTGGRFAGRWQVRNSANADTVGGDFSVVASRGTGAPTLGSLNGAAVTTFDYTGATLAGAPGITITANPATSGLDFGWPGFNGLTCDVRVVVDDGIFY